MHCFATRGGADEVSAEHNDLTSSRLLSRPVLVHEGHSNPPKQSSVTSPDRSGRLPTPPSKRPMLTPRPRPRRPTQASRTCRVDSVRVDIPCALDGAPALLAAATAALSGAAAARAWLRRPQHHSAVKSRRPAAPSSRHPRKQTRRMGRAITPTSTPSRRGDSVGGRGRVLSQYIKLVV